MSRLALAAVLSALCLSGCAYTEEEFREEFDAASCDWQADCYDYQDYAECLEQARAAREPAPSGCELDRRSAQDCVDDYAAIDCPNGAGLSAELPASCMEVWICD